MSPVQAALLVLLPGSAGARIIAANLRRGPADGRLRGVMMVPVCMAMMVMVMPASARIFGVIVRMLLRDRRCGSSALQRIHMVRSRVVFSRL
jgi:hypothetical protein